MDAPDLLRTAAALAAVLGLILACAWAAKRFGLGGALAGATGQRKRLAVADTLTLDARTRLVLVRRDGAEHLLLLNATGATVVETGIDAPADAAPAAPHPASAALTVLRMAAGSRA